MQLKKRGSNMQQTNDIAIVGMGVGGLASLIQLVEDPILSKKIKTIYVFDKNPINESNIFWHSTDRVYLNTSASLNSLLPGDDNHFYNWALSKPSYANFNITPETFLPRPVYGSYMKELFELYLEKAKLCSIHVTVINDYVKSYAKRSELIQITQSNGIKSLFRYAIFSIGNDRRTKNAYNHLETSDAYLKRPCMPLERYHHIKKHKKVLVIGGRLSAVDAILLLADGRAKITIASRSGTFPSVRRTFQYDKKKYEELLSYKSLRALLGKILSELPPQTDSSTDIEDLQNCYELATNWHDYVGPFLSRANDLWLVSSQSEKNEFWEILKKTRATRHTFAMPCIVADKIAPLLCGKRLVIKKGLQEVKYDGKHFIAMYDNNTTESFGACINATHVTDNTKVSIDFDAKMKNVYNLRDIDTSPFLNNAIFLFVREAQKIIEQIKKEETGALKIIRENDNLIV
jgi:uncharacterized NAD(P)/FAD-binding protein YdhS